MAASAEERSALVSTEDAGPLGSSQPEGPRSNRPRALALACGGALLLLLVATVQRRAAADDDCTAWYQQQTALTEEVRALRLATDTLAASTVCPAAEMQSVAGLPGATLLVLQPEELGSVVPTPRGAVLVEAGPSAELVGAHLLWLEGPAVAGDGAVLFTDTIAGQLLSWDATAGVQVMADPSGAARQCVSPRIDDGAGGCLQVLEPGANGLLVLPERSELLFADHGQRRIGVLSLPMRHAAARATLVAKFRGGRFNSPNDLARSPTTGDVYFTDPPYGIRLATAACAATVCPPAGCTCGHEFSDTPEAWFEQRAPSGRLISGVYRLPAAALRLSTAAAREAQLERLVDDLDYPNGIAVSPDGQKLFIAESGPRSRIVWLALLRSGSVAAGTRAITLITNAAVIRTNVAVSSRLQLLQHPQAADEETAAAAAAVTGWALGATDGMTCDSMGLLWATAAGGVIVLNSTSGAHLATVRVGGRAGNVVLAEDGWLYVAADHRLLRFKTNARPQL